MDWESRGLPGHRRQAGSGRRALRSCASVRDQPAREAAHDILAAEAFAVPAPDPRLRHDPVLPRAPDGAPEPHDILAAEEFAMPVPETGSMAGRVRAVAPGRAQWPAIVGLGLLVYWVIRSRSRR